LNAPITLIIITGQAQKSVPVGALHLLGLPGETMSRMVPFKRLWTNLIAAWKNTPEGHPGSVDLFTYFRAPDSGVEQPDPPEVFLPISLSWNGFQGYSGI
jgi:hypothetical protein